MSQVGHINVDPIPQEQKEHMRTKPNDLRLLEEMNRHIEVLVELGAKKEPKIGVRSDVWQMLEQARLLRERLMRILPQGEKE